MQLIEAAERLFYVNGYENTSVQDVLDEIHFSKGGFYHHFDSKLSLLHAICETRAQETCEAAAELLSHTEGTSLEKLNQVLHASAIWQGGGPGFVSLLIGVAYREDGALMRERMKECQLSGMQDLVVEILSEGRKAGELWASDLEGTAQLILRLYTQFTDEVAFLLAREESREALAEKLVRKLTLYRDAIERILIAPIGSIILFEADELLEQGWQIVEDRLRREAGLVQMRIDL